MDPSIFKMQDILKLRGYSPKTIKVYMSNMNSFFNNITEPLSNQQIDNYILKLINSRRYRENTINQVINSIHFYCKHVINDIDLYDNLRFLKKQKYLPQVLSIEEVKSLLKVIKNIKHKVMFSLIYSSGLRVGEVVLLKLEDIDFDRNLIHIKRAKGKKDRYTLLSNMSKNLIDNYIKVVEIDHFLFPGQKHHTHLAIRSVQQVMHRKVKEANIKKHVTVHSLRHSFATHLLEQGVDIRYIQELLGHKNIKTTEMYTHVALPNIRKIKNPLDE